MNRFVATTNKMSISTILILALAAMINFSSCKPKFGAENVCNKTVTVRKDRTVDEPVKYEIQYEGMCGILPCTKTRTETRMDSKMKAIWQSLQIRTCCPGYAEAPDQQCMPICLKSCNNGDCIKPGVCKCNPEPVESSPGYAGSACNRFVCLATNRWGSKCDRKCNCPPNSYCSASTGNCLCHSGWRGANCTEECDSIMNCQDAELPPIMEPEANMIHSEVIGPASQKLEALSPRALHSISDNNDDNIHNGPMSNLISNYMGIIILLMVLVLTLLGALFWYKRQLSQIENQLYYMSTATSPSQSNGSSDYEPYSTYSVGSVNSRIQSRSLPLAESKNLSFDSATRNVLTSLSPSLKNSNDIIANSNRNLQRVIVDPIVEIHLMASQKKSTQNVYSDLDSSAMSSSNKSSMRDNSRDTFGSSDSLLISGQSSCTMLNISTSSSSACENDYAVPKSPLTITLPVILRNDAFHNGYDHSNIYEEIKPKTQAADEHSRTSL